jgi:hypothetical protein
MATSPKLSNKTEFPFFFRVVSSDKYQGRALFALCKTFGWRNVGVLAARDLYRSMLSPCFCLSVSLSMSLFDLFLLSLFFVSSSLTLVHMNSLFFFFISSGLADAFIAEVEAFNALEPKNNEKRQARSSGKAGTGPTGPTTSPVSDILFHATRVDINEGAEVSEILDAVQTIKRAGIAVTIISRFLGRPISLKCLPHFFGDILVANTLSQCLMCFNLYLF